MTEDREMSVTEHLEELRGRLIVSIAAFLLGVAAAWSASAPALSRIADSVGGLVFLAPTEAFLSRLKVAALGGLLLSLPVILYEAWAFTACAMGGGLRRAVRVLLPLSYVLFLTGAGIAAFLVTPVAVRVLVGFGPPGVRPMLSVGTYVDFLAGLSLAFGAVFQIPLVLIVLNKAGVVRREWLAGRREYVYLGAAVAAAVMTPGPDVFSQLALAVPMLLLFELALLAMRFI